MRLAIDHNGEIVIAGDTTTGGNGGNVLIARLIVLTNLSASLDTAKEVVIDDIRGE